MLRPPVCLEVPPKEHCAVKTWGRFRFTFWGSRRSSFTEGGCTSIICWPFWGSRCSDAQAPRPVSKPPRGTLFSKNLGPLQIHLLGVSAVVLHLWECTSSVFCSFWRSRRSDAQAPFLSRSPRGRIVQYKLGAASHSSFGGLGGRLLLWGALI